MRTTGGHGQGAATGVEAPDFRRRNRGVGGIGLIRPGADAGPATSAEDPGQAARHARADG